MKKYITLLSLLVLLGASVPSQAMLLRNAKLSNTSLSKTSALLQSKKIAQIKSKKYSKKSNNNKKNYYQSFKNYVNTSTNFSLSRLIGFGGLVSALYTLWNGNETETEEKKKEILVLAHGTHRENIHLILEHGLKSAYCLNGEYLKNVKKNCLDHLEFLSKTPGYYSEKDIEDFKIYVEDLCKRISAKYSVYELAHFNDEPLIKSQITQFEGILKDSDKLIYFEVCNLGEFEPSGTPGVWQRKDRHDNNKDFYKNAQYVLIPYEKMLKKYPGIEFAYNGELRTISLNGNDAEEQDYNQSKITVIELLKKQKENPECIQFNPITWECLCTQECLNPESSCDNIIQMNNPAYPTYLGKHEVTIKTNHISTEEFIR